MLYYSVPKLHLKLIMDARLSYYHLFMLINFHLYTFQKINKERRISIGTLNNFLYLIHIIYYYIKLIKAEISIK